MILNCDQILDNNVFENLTFDTGNFTNANYNLRIGKFINRQSDEDVDVYCLEPRGLVVAISEECFNMPEDVIGYTTLKNDLSIQGIMAINVGLVDPLYKGPISSALINFGKEKIYLKKGSSFLRMTFHKFDKPKKCNSKRYEISPEHYLIQRSNSALKYLDNTFLNMNSICKEISNEVKKDNTRENNKYHLRVGALGVLLGGITLCYTFIIRPNIDKASKNELKNGFENVDEQSNYNQELKVLKNENDNLKKENAKLKENIVNSGDENYKFKK